MKTTQQHFNDFVANGLKKFEQNKEFNLVFGILVKDTLSSVEKLMELPIPKALIDIRAEVAYGLGRTTAQHQKENLFKELKIVALMIGSEVWYSKVAKKDIKNWEKGVGLPSKDPERKEGIMFLCSNPDNKIVFGKHIEISRPKNKIVLKEDKVLSKALTESKGERQELLCTNFWKGFNEKTNK